MARRRSLIIGVAVLLGLMVMTQACGGSSGAPPVQPTFAPSSTATTAKRSVTPAAPAMRATDQPSVAATVNQQVPSYRLGQTAQLDGGVTITVSAVQFPAAITEVNGTDDGVPIAVLLKWCAGPALPPGGLTAGGPFSMAVQTADDAIYTEFSGNQGPLPELGMTSLAPNQCVKGWATLVVPGVATPVRFMVYPDGVDSVPVVWALGKLQAGTPVTAPSPIIVPAP